jgi:hypothetical protein
MSGTSGESPNKGNYQEAKQIYDHPDSKIPTSLEIADNRSTQVLQAGAKAEVKISVRIVPQSPQLGKDQTKTG